MQLIRKLAVAALLQTALAAGAADVLPAAAPAVPAAADAAAVMSASYPLLDLVPGGRSADRAPYRHQRHAVL